MKTETNNPFGSELNMLNIIVPSWTFIKMHLFINGLQVAAFCVIQYFANVFGHGTLSPPLNTYHIAASDTCVSPGA